MMKWVTFGLVAAASLGLAGASFATVPYSAACTVTCECHADALGGASTQTAAGKCTITPGGANPAEDIHVHVNVANVLGSPLQNSTVVVSSVDVGGAVHVWDNGVSPVEPDEDPQTGLTNGSGDFTATFDEGGVLNADVAASPNLDFSITASEVGNPANQVVLPSCSPQLSTVSYDLNGNGVVNSVDFGEFAGDFGTGNTKSDFNFSGGVINSVDFGFFAQAFGDDINNQ